MRRRSAIDTYLALVSVRVVRDYSERAISDDSLRRVLEAGRATGSSQNRQDWAFYVVRGQDRLRELAGSVYAPENIAGCQAAIAIVTGGRATLDAGRCLQNMVLAAWNEGIGSAPNGVRDAEAAMRVLGAPQDTKIAVVLSLGYPQHHYIPRANDVEGILRRIKRKPLEELVTWVE